MFCGYSGVWSLDSQNVSTYSVFLVFYAENFAYYGYIIVAAFYLCVRSCIKHKLEPESWFSKKNLLADEETLVAHRYILNMIYNVYIPFIS